MFVERSHWDTELQLCDDKVHTVSKIFWAPANGHSSWFILFLYDSNSWKTEMILHAAFIYATAKKEVQRTWFMYVIGTDLWPNGFRAFTLRHAIAIVSRQSAYSFQNILGSSVCEDLWPNVFRAFTLRHRVAIVWQQGTYSFQNILGSSQWA